MTFTPLDAVRLALTDGMTQDEANDFGDIPRRRTARNFYIDPVDGPQHHETPDDYEAPAWQPGDDPAELARLVTTSRANERRARAARRRAFEDGDDV